MSRLLKSFNLLFFLFLVKLFAFGQCSMCKATAEAGSAQASEKLNDGILYLMILPYILFTGIVIAVIITLRKRKKANTIVD